MTAISDSVNSVSVPVRIVVTDENDNKPNFTFVGPDRFYSFLVLEGAQRNSFVGRVEATDADEARNGHVKYFMETPGLDSIFNLDENSGVLTVNGFIDHETVCIHLKCRLLFSSKHIRSYTSNFYSWYFCNSAKIALTYSM